MVNITMYASQTCPFCHRAVALLESKHVPFQYIDVDQNPQRRVEMSQKANATSVPQIWIDDYHIGGCDNLCALEQQGKLDPLLG